MATLLTLMISVVGVAAWSHWRINHVLIDSHGQAALALTQRFEQDIALYVDQQGLEEAIQYVVDMRSTGSLLLWFVDSDQRLVAQSKGLSLPSTDSTLTTQLIQWNQEQPLTIQTLADRQWIICQKSIDTAGMHLGQLTIAEDITQLQNTLVALGQNLFVASGVMLALAGSALLWLSARYLRPLAQLATMAPQQLATAGPTDFSPSPPTEMRQLLRTCQHLAAQVVNTQQQQQQLVKDISHELRTPLTLVQGYLQSTLRRSRSLSDPHREGLEIAAAEADRTITLLRDLADLARIDSGQFRLQLEPISLGSMIQSLVQQSPDWPQRLTLHLPPNPILCQGDQQRLAQVLTQLIDNGLRHSPAQTSVEIQVWQRESWAMIAVQDQGVGIPLIAQAKIFEPFYRVESDRSRSTGGSGLGLAIAKALVVAMGGTLQVQSAPDQGSTFTVCLPCP